ncbi:MAG: hypothetical protein RJA70_1577 [Pseudomonadota bacterium]|jgi:predicted AAA+ superfamily ATPase
MTRRYRLYDAIVEKHLKSLRQMVFLAGPRQVGKTTVARKAADIYLDWDLSTDQQLIVAGSQAVAERAGLSQLREHVPVLAFDELHKFGAWKNWLKGFFDSYAERSRVVVTGSSRLDVYRRGGDSLMGRYFLYHMHPLSVAELLKVEVPGAKLVRPPAALAEPVWQALWQHGGFPEPFTKRSRTFSLRWHSHRINQLLREDIRDLTRVQELGQLSALATLLSQRSGDQLVYSNLATEVRVAEDTVRRWVQTLVSLHLGFVVRPWFRNVAKSLRKEPKWFLRDWSSIADLGKRAETLVACHLLKAVDTWGDLGLGVFELRYLRDKQKREVDFIVIRDGAPWFLVEVKHGDAQLAPALQHFQMETAAPHAFQVVIDLPFVKRNCFAQKGPVVVPARTFLSQLV